MQSFRRVGGAQGWTRQRENNYAGEEEIKHAYSLLIATLAQNLHGTKWPEWSNSCKDTPLKQALAYL